MNRNELIESINSINSRLGLYGLLFDKQIDFIFDKSKRKAALCSRRAGKSYSIAVDLIETALARKSSRCVYLSLTRTSSKAIIWQVILDLIQLRNIKYNSNKVDLTIEFENGSVIYVIGADDPRFLEKLKGVRNDLVVIDEAASFGPHLSSLISSTLEPTLVDRKGTMYIIGTPGAACIGKFYEITTLKNSSWKVYKWTMRDNPFLPDVEEFISEIKKENNWTDETPQYRREYLGEWVYDANSMVYRFREENIVNELPRMTSWNHLLGVDLGYDDDTAFQIVSSSHLSPICYFHSGWKKSRMSVTDVANKIKEYMNKYPIYKVVMDTGGIGKMVCEEIKIRHSLPIEAAEKSDKMGSIELLNADFLTEKVKVLSDEPIIDEWKILQWDEKRKHEDNRYPNHLSDAGLYAYREARHWTHRDPPKEILPNTDEYYENEKKRMLNFMFKKYRNPNNKKYMNYR